MGYLALASDLLIAFDTINNTFARHVRRALSLYLHTADTPQNTTERKEEHKDEEEHFAIGDSPRQILLIYTTNQHGGSRHPRTSERLFSHAVPLVI